MAELFSRDDVERVARLARLELTAAEKDLFATQLADILTYARQLERVDTTGVEPTAHAVATVASLREDVVVDSLTRDVALSAAPDASQAAGLFKVPRVIG